MLSLFKCFCINKSYEKCDYCIAFVNFTLIYLWKIRLNIPVIKRVIKITFKYTINFSEFVYSTTKLFLNN